MAARCFLDTSTKLKTDTIIMQVNVDLCGIFLKSKHIGSVSFQSLFFFVFFCCVSVAFFCAVFCGWSFL